MARIERLPPPLADPVRSPPVVVDGGGAECEHRRRCRGAHARAGVARGAPSSSATRTRSTAGACTARCRWRSRRCWRTRRRDAVAWARFDFRGVGDERRDVRRRARGGGRRARRHRAPARRAPRGAHDACAGTRSARGSRCARPAPRRRVERRAARRARARASSSSATTRFAFSGPKTIFIGDQDEFCDVDEARELADETRRGLARLRGLRPPLH